MTATRLAGPRATKASLPSPVMRTPTGWMASERMPAISKVIFLTTLRVLASMTLTVPPISDDTQTCFPSPVNSATRGRVSTSTLSTTLYVPVSMKWAMLVVSEVVTRTVPSGLMPIPSGSTPTGTSAITVPFSRSMTVTMLSSSLAT